MRKKARRAKLGLKRTTDDRKRTIGRHWVAIQHARADLPLQGNATTHTARRQFFGRKRPVKKVETALAREMLKRSKEE